MMKNGYVTLLSLIVAYSAFQGTGASSPDSPRKELKALPEEARSAVLAQARNLQGIEPFPTISDGVCKLTLGGDHPTPCGGCRAVCPAKDLASLIEDYFRAEYDSEKKHPTIPWHVPQPERTKIKFVIASLPDPVHTHMALLFDRGIETIQSAAQASGYLFSRAWMPWDISALSGSTDFTVRLAEEKLRAQKETLPGLMIFQRSEESAKEATDKITDQPKTILFVFVVGETPTGGIHVEQFQHALEIRQSILTVSDTETKTLRIHGPSFSGSLKSLEGILSAQPHDLFSTVLIRSGWISSYRAVHDFNEHAIAQWPDITSGSGADTKSSHVGRPDFATFQFSDKYEEFYLSHFFCDRHNPHSHVAILSEDETAFGNQESRADAKSIEQPSPPMPDPCPAEPIHANFEFKRLYFPREIAQLRDAYQRNVQIQSLATGAKSTPQTGLALSLGVTGNDDDSVAPYSPLQTPLSQESILQAIVTTLRKEHAKIVIIRASDPLDMIFLARYLRQNYPQARLVTTGVDLLMVHDFYDPRFHGILAVTPYPLLTGTHFPSRVQKPPTVEHLFPDSLSVGGFNAFESLLADNSEVESKKLPAADYIQFGMPSFLQEDAGLWHAHLWLMTVGRDGYWPVAVLDGSPPGIQTKQNPPELAIRAVDARTDPPESYEVHLSVGWTIFWALAFGLTVVMAFLLMRPKAFSRSAILERFGGDPSRARNCLLFLGSVLLMAAQTLFVFPVVIWLGLFGKIDGLSLWRCLGQVLSGAGTLTKSQFIGEALNGMWLVMIGYVVSAILLGFASYKGFKARGSDRLSRSGAITFSGLAVLAVLLAWAMQSRVLDSRFGSFLYRYFEVGSGVSPFLPLLFLLAGWIWWCWQSLTGVTSTLEKFTVLPKASAFTEAVVPDALDRVRMKALVGKENEWPWQTLAAVPYDGMLAASALVGFLMILLLMRPGEIAEAFEPWTYKVLYWFLLYSCLFLVCFLVTHIVALWLQFRVLLRAIEAFPLRRGFGDLTNLTWKPLWKLAGNGKDEFRRLLGDELTALTQIEKSGTQDVELTSAIKNAKAKTENVSAEWEKLIDGKGSTETGHKVQKLFHDLQTELSTTASAALIYVNNRWRDEEYAPSAAKDFKKDSEGKDTLVEPPAKNPRTRAVEHFLCLFYLNIVLVPLRRLQTLILALAGVFVFVLLSYSSYPFESRESFHVLLISIFFVISLVVGIVYGQMYSNPLLSRITNTKPGELGLDFWVRLGTFVFIPLLSLLSVQFPEINGFLFSWLQPALQSLK